jgi:peptidoglycan hydrolase CwlO-like protein
MMRFVITLMIFVVAITTINAAQAIIDDSKFCDFHSTKSGCLEQCGCSYCGFDKKCYNADHIAEYCSHELIVSNKLECQIKDLGEQIKKIEDRVKDRDEKIKDMDNKIKDKDNQLLEAKSSRNRWIIAFWTTLGIGLIVFVGLAILIGSLIDIRDSFITVAKQCDKCKKHIK